MEAAFDAWLPGGFAGGVCICLDDPAWQAAKTRLANVFPLTRMFPAVDMRGLLTHGTASAVRKLRDLPFRMTTQVMYDVCMHTSYKFIEQIVTPGAIGCAQSHLSIWSAFLNGTLACERPDAEWLLVFESDVDPVKDCMNNLRTLLASPKITLPMSHASLSSAAPFTTNEPKTGGNTTAQAMPSCIRLGWSVFKPGQLTPSAHPAFDVWNGKTWYTHAYFIRKSAIPACLSAMVPLASQIDTAMGHAADLGIMPPQWLVRKKLFTQELQHALFNSTIRQKHLLRAALPESAAATEALIIVPYALVLLLIIALIVSIVVLKKQK